MARNFLVLARRIANLGRAFLRRKRLGGCGVWGSWVKQIEATGTGPAPPLVYPGLANEFEDRQRLSDVPEIQQRHNRGSGACTRSLFDGRCKTGTDAGRIHVGAGSV